MRTSVFFTLVASLACAVAQSLPMDPDKRSGTSIDMLEVRRVNRPSTPSGQDHNVKIVLSQHQPIPTLSQWSLTIVRTNEEVKYYSVQAQDPYQTEVEFEADLTDGAYIYLEGKSSDGTTNANSFTQLATSLLSSRVARVGTKYDESVSSLRVWTGDMGEVAVGLNPCKKVGTPCYYLSTTLPRDVPRCVTTYNNVKQCDDFITDFQEFHQNPRLNITSNGMLTVETILESNVAKMEAVVFDPQDPSRIFSPDNYKCQLEVNQEIIHCQQQLKDIGDLQKFMVLLVSLNQEGFVLGSKMELYGGDSTVYSSNTGVIVGSVVGGVLVVALLAGAAVYFIKKKKGGSKDTSSGPGASSTRYDVVSSSTGGRMDA